MYIYIWLHILSVISIFYVGEIQEWLFGSIFHILSATHLFLIFYVSAGYYNILYYNIL